NALHGTEVGEVHQQGLVVGDVIAALFQSFRFAHVLVAIHEVRNHLDVLLDVENANGTVAQILRDCSHAIALFDGKARNRKIGAVEPDQSDVGAVEGCDKG